MKRNAHARLQATGRGELSSSSKREASNSSCDLVIATLFGPFRWRILLYWVISVRTRNRDVASSLYTEVMNDTTFSMADTKLYILEGPLAPALMALMRMWRTVSSSQRMARSSLLSRGELRRRNVMSCTARCRQNARRKRMPRCLTDLLEHTQCACGLYAAGRTRGAVSQWLLEPRHKGRVPPHISRREAASWRLPSRRRILPQSKHRSSGLPAPRDTRSCFETSACEGVLVLSEKIRKSLATGHTHTPRCLA